MSKSQPEASHTAFQWHWTWLRECWTPGRETACHWEPHKQISWKDMMCCYFRDRKDHSWMQHWSVCVCVYARAYIYLYVCICKYQHVCMCVYICDCVCVCVGIMCICMYITDSVTPWTVTHQASLSMEFSRQKYWRGQPFPSPGDLSYPGITPGSPSLQADSLPSEPQGKPLIYMYYVYTYMCIYIYMNTQTIRLAITSSYHI